MRSERDQPTGIPNRRTFLARCAGVGVGVAAPSAFAVTPSTSPAPRPRGDGLLRWPLDRMEVLGIPRDWSAVGLGLHPFAPERTLVLPSGRRLRDACASSGRSTERVYESLVRRWAERGYRPEAMAREKQDAIVWIIDAMTRHYHRTELFEDWARGLMGRESLGSTGIGGYFGLAHQFQHGGEVEVDCPPVDWWLILCPDGIDWESLDDEPVHMLFAHAAARPWRPGHRDPLFHAYCLSCRIVREIDDSRPISRMRRLAADRFLNPIAARTLAEMDDR